MSIRQVAALSEAQLVELTTLFQDLWWTPGRQLDGVRIAVENSSLVIGLVDDAAGDRLIGFCRVLTDYVYRAMLHDVVVDPAYRGQQLGRRLMDAVIEHPRLQNVDTITLACSADMIPFYRQFDFDQQESEIFTLRRKKIA
ncbi:GNAT family N-acetyltransferase [Blastopirellula marina]|uniref:GCN5-related N-acetyltransferase n=1 Tax=Blastopirellula marina DSM 3645 TaxID=314230 RepID=A3ZSW0_9BACT|nr:GNAT family N-acetyltransferase [Blastopirellula marina]EAQ80385.1 GCN5-related N-acetyltransferase [Blastopirellula marina DSM 3645]